MDSQQTLADIRSDYSKAELSEQNIVDDALEQLQIWLQEASTAQVPEYTAMTLATVNANNAPSARVVLLKGVDTGLVFYTNYSSRKGSDISANRAVAAVFFWPELERQIRIEGIVEKVGTEESREYFSSRPLGSQLAAWASKQSSVVSSRQQLEEQYKLVEQRFEHEEITLPPTWGGYRILPQKIEFWQGRRSRMHDRLQYSLLSDGSWSIERLAP